MYKTPTLETIRQKKVENLKESRKILNTINDVGNFPNSTVLQTESVKVGKCVDGNSLKFIRICTYRHTYIHKCILTHAYKYTHTYKHTPLPLHTRIQITSKSPVRFISQYSSFFILLSKN